MEYYLLAWQREADATSHDSAHDALLGFYIDDGFMVARHHVLQRAHAFLDGPRARESGLYLGEKCELWWPTAPRRSDQDRYHAKVRINCTQGTSVLGVPIGTHVHTSDSLLRQVRALEPLMQQLSELPDAHVAFALLRACFGTCRVNYALRAMPPSTTSAAADAFDNLTAAVLRRLSMGVITDEVMSELRLPVRHDDPERPHFGVGLTAATDVAPAAYMASVCATRSIAKQLRIGGAWRSLDQNEHVLHAHALLSRLAPSDNEVAKMPTVAQCTSAPETPTQHELVSIVHAGRWCRMPRGDARTQAFRATLCMPGAKDWLRCMPSPAHGTHITDRFFRAWLAFFARAHTRPHNMLCCPRPGCRAPLDAHGDHLMHCPNSSAAAFAPVVRRHDQVVREIADALSSAARRSRVELRDPHRRTRSRPDIIATSERGGMDALDIAVTHTFRNAQAVRRRQEAAMHEAYSSKLSQHREYAAQHNARTVPMIFAASGAWHVRSHAYMLRVTQDIASVSDQPLALVRAHTFQRIAATLVMGNARALLAGVHKPLW